MGDASKSSTSQLERQSYIHANGTIGLEFSNIDPINNLIDRVTDDYNVKALSCLESIEAKMSQLRFSKLSLGEEIETCKASIDRQNKSLRDFKEGFASYVKNINDMEDSVVEQLSKIISDVDRVRDHAQSTITLGTTKGEAFETLLCSDIKGSESEKEVGGKALHEFIDDVSDMIAGMSDFIGKVKSFMEYMNILTALEVAREDNNLDEIKKDICEKLEKLNDADLKKVVDLMSEAEINVILKECSPELAKKIKEISGIENVSDETGETGYKDSTMKLIMKLEGEPFLIPRINDNGTITIGYGYDFTKESDPDMFNKYLKVDSNGNIIVTGKMSIEDAGETIKKVAEKLGIISALDDFINGRGYGNAVKPLTLNQNQYDALFSYFYSNGKNVFSDSKYNEWTGYGGEYAKRAKARKELRDYLINNNGNYNTSEIIELFVNSKGGNPKYDYKDRRETEGSEFNQK